MIPDLLRCFLVFTFWNKGEWDLFFFAEVPSEALILMSVDLCSGRIAVRLLSCFSCCADDLLNLPQGKAPLLPPRTKLAIRHRPFKGCNINCVLLNYFLSDCFQQLSSNKL